MTENSPSTPNPEQELLPEWTERMEEGIDNIIENFELFYSPGDEEVVTPLAIDPSSLSEGLDTRLLVDLSDKEREYLRSIVRQKLGVHAASRILRSYTFANPDSSHTSDQGHWRGEAKVKVYETIYSDEQGIFLHELQRPDYPSEDLLADVDYTFEGTE